MNNNDIECIYEGDSLVQSNNCAFTITITDHNKKAQMYLQQGDTKKAI